MSLLTTPSQTVGPYLRIGFMPLITDTIAPAGVSGERVTIRGRMSDGDGRPINDGVLEIWQADAQGKYAHPEHGQQSVAANAFRGFGRILTDANGAFRFSTIKPGPVPGPDGEPLNETDAVLKRVPADRRATLVAAATGKATLQWNIVSQGPDETVFFDF